MSAATENCVKCYKKATCFGGHVHKGEEEIIAGFCKTHFQRVKKNKKNAECEGCYGEWVNEMGVSGDSFCHVSCKVNINLVK